jgi:molybdopterin/thiamine biosynthesis adenylyltransferase
MLNTKSFSVIDRDKIKGNIHVVGCGAMGSLFIQNLCRLNLSTKIIAYDMDVVEEKNLNNQAYFRKHIGMKKVDAIKDLASMIDDEGAIRIQDREVKYLRTNSNDVVVLAIDNYHARAAILERITGNPLVISGGVNARGGNVEVIRGDYKTLAAEYAALESGQEYDEDDLTPCGSPISIYHRINTEASLMAEELVTNYGGTEDISKNVVFDLPNLFFVNA